MESIPEYIPGQIIKYKEKQGYKRTIYAIVTEQLNPNCIHVITGQKENPSLALFLNPKTTFSPISIEKIIDSYKDIPIIDKKGNFHPERQYIREIAKLIQTGIREYKVEENGKFSSEISHLYDIINLIEKNKKH
jgi:hypothetical protein